ncbi:MAG TPA: hypothetical protein VKB31_04355 [Trueperaceae bacterium]|nr:hypothetical protein [Trueperaceae bacterium]
MERANRSIEPVGADKRGPRGAKKLAAAVAALSLALLVLPSSLAATHLPKNSNVHAFTIKETDYKFTPNHMTWYVGEKVRITLENESKSPATQHEFLIGRGVAHSKTKFGKSFPSGWKTNLLSNDAKVEWGQGKRIAHLQKGAPGHAALNPGGQVTEQFTVPDKPGTWHYACFEQKGEHYKKGMKGTITIEPKGSSSGGNGSSSGGSASSNGGSKGGSSSGG